MHMRLRSMRPSFWTLNKASAMVKSKHNTLHEPHTRNKFKKYLTINCLKSKALYGTGLCVWSSRSFFLPFFKTFLNITLTTFPRGQGLLSSLTWWYEHVLQSALRQWTSEILDLNFSACPLIMLKKEEKGRTITSEDWGADQNPSVWREYFLEVTEAGLF